MEINVLNKPVKSVNAFSLNVELKELTTNSNIVFNAKEDFSSFWNGKKLTIPVYGVYKISWGFYQDSIHTFYNEVKTQLNLVVNDEIHEEKVEITKNTPIFHAVKSSHKSLTLLLREGELLSLKAKTINGENPNMKDIYFKVEKLNVDENNTLGYEN